MVALAHLDTAQSKQTVEAVRRFDDQARTTISNIAKFNAASEVRISTCWSPVGFHVAPELRIDGDLVTHS